MNLLALDTLNLLASLVFLAGGVALLVVALRRSLKHATEDRMDHARRAEAEANYWRSMDGAVDKLSELLASIEEQIGNRTRALKRLTTEAEGGIARLAKALEGSDRAMKKRKRSVSGGSAADSAAGGGKIVDFKAASEALAVRAHGRIYQAHDSGVPLQDISRETGLQLGELELILALRDKLGSHAG